MASKAFLQQAYLAYFGRPADVSGLAYYADQSEAQVKAAFSASPESQAFFGSMDVAAQINTIYNNLFNRDAEPAGLTYWSKEIGSGRLSLADAAMGILAGAQNADKVAVANKLAASDAFTAALNTTAEILGYAGAAAVAPARAYLANVDATAASLTAATAGVDAAVVSVVTAGSVVAGQTFMLTASAPSVTETDSATKVLTFTLTLDKAPAADLVINYAVDSTSTAVLGDDFTVTAGNVTFAAGQTTAEIQVNVLADDADEANETIVLSLTNNDMVSSINGASSVKRVNDLKATGTIVDDDASFVFTSAAANSVAENTTAVVTVAGADADSATGLTTTLTGADAALFSLTNGALAFKTAPNFEAPADAGANNVYNVSVNVADGSGNVGTQNLVITVTNVNETPSVSSAATGTVAENAAITTAVYTAAASDVDAGDVMTYTLSGTDAAAFAINAAGVVTLNASANFEAKSSYAIDVTATDAGGLSNTKAVTVAVTNVNEAPVVSSAATGTVAENAAISTVVYTATSTDVDAADSATYSLGGADAAAFAINATTGAVTLNASADFETKASYAIDVTATDAGGLTNTKSVAVAVTNVNEAPVVTSAATATVAENAATSTVVYTATSSDVDAADSATYSLGGADAAAFAINATTGAVTLQASADRETKASYAIDVTATDAGGLTNTKSVAVAVSNVNEAPTGVADSLNVADNTAVTFNVLTNDVKVDASNTISVGSFTQPSNGTLVSNGNGSFTYTPSATFLSGVDSFTYTPVEAGGESGVATTVTIQVNTVNSAPVVTAGQTFGVTENTNTAGQSVGFVVATDEEGGMPQNWTITAGNAAGNFAINAFTGEITTTNTANFDYETTASYALSVTAKDGTGLVSAAQTVTINVADVNEAPAMTSAATATVAENAATSTVVYTATSTDVDAGDSATYSLGGADAAAFSIDATTGDVTLNASADFEAQPSYSIDVTVTDASGLTSTQAVAVTVTDVNEAPVVTSGATATVAENAAIATVIYTATATDVDAGDTLAYSLTGTDAAAFAIDATTGVVTLNASADFEAQASYAINVVATDAGGLTSTQAVAVTVTDVNEAPVVTSAATATVAENSPITTVVYTATATDVDAGDTHTFSLTGTDAAAFAIDAITGVVTLNAPADFEAQASYAINVVATDAGGLTSTQAVAVAVTDDGGGQNYILTTDADFGADFTGTDNDDIFYANNAAETSTNDVPDVFNTLTSLDVIDGGLGSDTLNITDFTVANAGLDTTTLVGLSVTNIETVNVTSVDATIIDTTAWTGVTEVNSTVSTASTVTAASTTDVNVTTSGNATVSGGNNVTITAAGTATVTGGQDVVVTAGGNTAINGATGNITATISSGDFTIGATSVPLGTVTATHLNAAAAGTQAINGGSSQTVSITGAALTNGQTGTAVTLGGTTPTTGAVNLTVANTTSAAVNTDAVTGGLITVNGGSTVVVNQTISNTGTIATGDVVTLNQGDIGINGTASTTTVTVNQTAAQTAAPITAAIDSATIVAGDVTIVDVNAADLTLAGSITTVSLSNFGDSSVDSSAINSVTLAGTGGTFGIGRGALTAVPTANTLTLNVNSLTGGAITDTTAANLGNGFTTITLNNTGTSVIADLDAADLTTLNISGSGNLTLTANALGGATTTAITNTSTGNVTLGGALDDATLYTGGDGVDTITVGATTQLITLGDGNDVVTFTAAAVIAGGGIVGGDGTDRLSMTAANAATASATIADGLVFQLTVTDFEELVLTGGVINVVDVARLGGFDNISTSGDTSLTLDNLTSGANLSITAPTTAVVANVTGSNVSATDVLNITLSNASNNAVAFGSITASNVETINITTTDAGVDLDTAATQDSVTLVAASATHVVVTGNNGLDMTNKGNTSIVSFDASGVVANDNGFTGFVANAADTTSALGVVFASENTTLGSAVTIIGGAGDDSLTGNVGVDIITGGAGADTITGGAGEDTLTGGADADTFVFDDGIDADTITDFVTATDTIQLSVAVIDDAGGTLAAALLADVDTVVGSEVATAAELLVVANEAALTGGTLAAATDAETLVYVTATGNLYLNADNATAGGLTLIGIFGANTTLAVSDVVFIA